MKFQSQIISRGSGSIGGLTASHNKGGNYFRARVTPTDPQTPQQTAVRSAMAQLVNVWTNILTAIQREAWDTYALNTPLIDTFGEPRTVTGLNMYTRANVPRLQNGDVREDDGPLIFNTGDVGPTSVGFAAGTQLVSVGFDDTDEWVDEDEAHMYIYTSRPQNVSINFFKGPYRLAGSIDGDATTPPTTPAALTSPFTFSAGQKMFGQLRVSRTDGRLSVVIPFEAIAIA